MAQPSAFFAVAAPAKANLVDYARGAKAVKRGGLCIKLSLTDVSGFVAVPEGNDMLELDAALTQLEQVDPRGAVARTQTGRCQVSHDGTWIMMSQ